MRADMGPVVAGLRVVGAVERPTMLPPASLLLSRAVERAADRLGSLAGSIRSTRKLTDEDAYKAELRTVDSDQSHAALALDDLAVAAIGYDSPPLTVDGEPTTIRDLRRDVAHLLLGADDCERAAEQIRAWGRVAEPVRDALPPSEPEPGS